MIESEWSIIESINKRINLTGLSLPDDLIAGSGDDCAVFKVSDSRFGLFTTDISIESTHFTINTTSPENIGFKAMMGNISDIASMGGFPRFAFISIGIPGYLNSDYIHSIYKGMIEAANISGAVIAGGDTSSSEILVLNICLYGETDTDPLMRNSARSGETICVTGTTGDSKAGLEILLSSNQYENKDFSNLIKKHQRPVSRLDIIPAIIKKFSPTSMIDVSDGLLSDLRHICTASRKGFSLCKEKIPLSDELVEYCKKNASDPFLYALESGEEYEIIFTTAVSPDKIKKNFSNILPVTSIGKITDNNYVLSENGKESLVQIKGFDHFKKK